MMPERITELWAWIATEEDGSEGICGSSMTIQGEAWMMPLIGADADRIESMRPHAMAVQRESRRPMKLKRFVLRPPVTEALRDKLDFTFAELHAGLHMWAGQDAARVCFEELHTLWVQLQASERGDG